MNKFKLFKKSNSFYWSTNKLYYCAIFIVIGLGYLSHQFFKSGEKTFQWLLIITLIVGLVLKLKGFTQIEPIRGTLDGDLIFEENSITVDNTFYSLEEINSLKISNDDYNGKLIRVSKGNIGPALSNGTNNWIIIFSKKSKENKKYFFELINPNDFQNIRFQLINYFLNGKIDFWDLSNVLGEKSKTEIEELKQEIEVVGTNRQQRI